MNTKQENAKAVVPLYKSEKKKIIDKQIKKMMKAIQFKSVLLVAVALLVPALTGCKDNDGTQDSILKPMEKHLTGKWNMVGNSIL